MKKNIYTHSIDLEKITVLNTDKKKFAKQLESIPYKGYEVEDIADGRKIVISKPGGKSSYGRPAKEDFFVFIFDPVDSTLWQITHKQILNDLEQKFISNSLEAAKIVDALELVYHGEEPDRALEKCHIVNNPTGELPEVLLKAYKWIWGQEDVNYPNHQGRAMSFTPILDLKKSYS